MKPKTEEFLNLLLWSADLLARPTFRNLTDSYESWAYRNGLLRQVATLERQQLLERDASSPDDRLYRLSAQACVTDVLSLKCQRCPGFMAANAPLGHSIHNASESSVGATFVRRNPVDERRPGAFEAFARQFLRRINAEFAAAGDFAGGVVEHVGRAFGEDAVPPSPKASADRRVAGRCWRRGRKRTSLVFMHAAIHGLNNR